MVASWKGYDTNDSKNMNYFVVPGRLQLRYYNQCKKLSINPHHDLKTLIEVRLSELGVNVKLEELYKMRESILFQIKELEENNNLSVVNKHLQKDLQDRVNSFRVDLQRGKLPSELNVYFVAKGLASKYELAYNEIIDMFKEKIVKELRGELKNMLLDRLELVRMNGNNGTLSDEQAAEVFKKKAEA
jgi:hypothetical protein